MRILFLHSEILGYSIAIFNQLSNMGCELHVVHKSKNKKTSFVIPEDVTFTHYPRESFSKSSLLNFSRSLSPVMVVVSGWSYKDYLVTSKYFKNTGVIVVCAFDNQWSGSYRQYLASFTSFFYLRRIFTHAWVPGVYQYEYARKLGFKKNEIILDLYSADIKRFSSNFINSLSIKELRYPHRFLFVGRLESVKGLDILTQAWRDLGTNTKDWELCLIGNGSFKDKLSHEPGITVKDFMQPSDLIKEISSAGCFLLPSRKEAWGVVVHEFTAAGLPIIISSTVGAAKSFLIDGFNGFTFQNESYESLKDQMLKIISSSDEELLVMSRNSNELSNRISPQSSASNLLSLLSK